MILPHISLTCGIVHGLRAKRHNNVVLHVAQMLNRRGFDVIVEPKFQTERGVR